MKYTVMECHAGFAVLMDEQARFVKAANLHYAVGQIVTEPVLMQDEPQITRSRSIVLKIAAAAACLVMVAGIGLNVYLNRRSTENEGESVVMVIEETQYEMQLNRSGEVIRVQSPDEAGQAVLAKYDGKKQKAADAANTLLKLQKTEAAIEDGKTVEIFIETENEEIYESCKLDIEKEAAKLNLNAAVQERIEPGKPHEHPEHSKPQTEPAVQPEQPVSEVEPPAEATIPAVQPDGRTEVTEAAGQEHTQPEHPALPEPARTAPNPQQGIQQTPHTVPNAPQSTPQTPEQTKPAEPVHTEAMKPEMPERGTTPTLPQVPWAHTPPHEEPEAGKTVPDDPKKAEPPADAAKPEEPNAGAPREEPALPQAEERGSRYQKPLVPQQPAKEMPAEKEPQPAPEKPDTPEPPQSKLDEEILPHERQDVPDTAVKPEEQIPARPDTPEEPDMPKAPEPPHGEPAEQDAELLTDIEMQSA